MKAGDAPEVDKQTVRVIIANADALHADPDLFARYIAGYRDTVDVDLLDPEGFAAYAKFSELSDAQAKRALSEFLPRAALDPARITGIDEAMADAVAYKFIAAPLSKAQVAELIQVPGGSHRFPRHCEEREARRSNLRRCSCASDGRLLRFAPQ